MQAQGQIVGRLATNGHDHPTWSLQLGNVHNTLVAQFFEVQAIRLVEVRRHSFLGRYGRFRGSLLPGNFKSFVQTEINKTFPSSPEGSIQSSKYFSKPRVRIAVDHDGFMPQRPESSDTGHTAPVEFHAASNPVRATA